MVSVDRRLVEEWLPLEELNAFGRREASFIRVPKINNIHTWWARRPAGTARVLTLASAMPCEPEGEVRDLLVRAVNLDGARRAKVIYMAGVRREAVKRGIKRGLVRDVVVVDPMAGGGSIPLESLRLGFRTVAVEYNPVAYLILKATVEFPARYADSGLFEEALREAKEMIGWARENLAKFYGVDAENYIFARGVRCPFCGGLVPVQGIEPEITSADRFKRRFLRLTYDKGAKTFSVETSTLRTERTIEKKGSFIKCPYCDKWFQLKGRGKSRAETAFEKWFRSHAELMRSVVEEYTPITPELEEKLLELHIPLVKQVGSSFEPVWGDDREVGLFLDAFRALGENVFELSEYMPLDPIPEESRWGSNARNKGLTNWYMLYNPRQLLVLSELSRYVARRAEELSALNGEFGAAVALYLAFSLSKLASYNTIATIWHRSMAVISPTIRGESTIDFRNEYCEMVATLPERSLEWALEPDVAESGALTRTQGGILPVLRFLTEQFKGSNLGDRISVYMADATELSSILGLNSVDVINVDPPYFEQVVYSDRSEFFWTILRRALWPVLDILFKPGLKLKGWTWKHATVPREHEVVAYEKQDKEERFRKFFKKFVAETAKTLKDDGVLILWFTHPTDLAWRTVGQSLYEAGYVVSKTWPLRTEMPTRYKKQVNVIAQEMTLAIVARKHKRKKLIGVSPELLKESLMENPTFKTRAKQTAREIGAVAREAGAGPADTMALLFGSALSVATAFTLPIPIQFDKIYDVAITSVLREFVEPLTTKILTESGPTKLTQKDAEVVMDYFITAMVDDPATRSYMTLWLLTNVDLETGETREEPLLLGYDFVQTTAKLLGYDFYKLRDLGLIATPPGAKNVFTPQLLKALTPAGARATWKDLLAITPGRAIHLAHTALRESGAPGTRAKKIRNTHPFMTWSDRELAEAASTAIILLETARDEELGFGPPPKGLEAYMPGRQTSVEAKTVRELAIRTLLNLLPKVGG